MPFIGSKSLAALIRDNQNLVAENAELQAATASLDAQLYAARLALTEAKAPQPASLSDVLAQLKGFVPTLPYAPGYSVLATASDPRSFAQGLHLMLMHARAVGQNEGRSAQ